MKQESNQFPNNPVFQPKEYCYQNSKRKFYKFYIYFNLAYILIWNLNLKNQILTPDDFFQESGQVYWPNLTATYFQTPGLLPGPNQFKMSTFFLLNFPTYIPPFLHLKKVLSLPPGLKQFKRPKSVKNQTFCPFFHTFGGIPQRTKTEFGISKSIPGYSYFWVAASGYQTYSFLLG